MGGHDARPNTRAFGAQYADSTKAQVRPGPLAPTSRIWWWGDQAMTHPSGYRPDDPAGTSAVRTQLRTHLPSQCLGGHGCDPRNSNTTSVSNPCSVDRPSRPKTFPFQLDPDTAHMERHAPACGARAYATVLVGRGRSRKMIQAMIMLGSSYMARPTWLYVPGAISVLKDR